MVILYFAAAVALNVAIWYLPVREYVRVYRTTR